MTASFKLRFLVLTATNAALSLLIVFAAMHLMTELGGKQSFAVVQYLKPTDRDQTSTESK